MNKLAALLALLLWPAFALGQTGAYSGHTFVGGVPATTSGMKSSNYMDGIIPGASVTVYLTGTSTKATIYADGSNTPLSNPFFSNLAPGTNPGGFIFWAAQNQGLDIQAQGGMGNASCTTSPLCYPTATTLQVDVYPNSSFSPLPSLNCTGTGSSQVCTFSGTVEAGTVSDGTASLHSGSLTGAANGTFSGTLAAGTRVSQSSTVIGTESNPFVSADGTGTIQAMITGLNVVRGGTVTLAPSRYDITAVGGVVVGYAGTTIQGTRGYGLDEVGCGGCAEGTTATKLHIDGAIGIAITNATPLVSRMGGIDINSIYFHGNGTTPQTSTTGVYINSETDQLHLNNLDFDNVGIGIWVHGVANNAATDTPTFDKLSILGSGIGIYADDDFFDLHLQNSTFANNNGAAICIPATSPIYYTWGDTITNNTIAYNVMATGGGGANCSGAEVIVSNGMLVLNNYIEQGGMLQTAADGVFIAGNGNTVSGNLMYQFWTGAAVHIKAGFQNNAVGPNTFINNFIDIEADATAFANVLNIPNPTTRVCDYSGQYYNAPNGWTISCPMYPQGSGTAWVNAAATVSSATDGWGGSEAVLIVPTTANTQHITYTSLGLPAYNAKVTFFAKASGYTWALLGVVNGGNTYYAYANLSTCAAGTSDPIFTSFTVGTAFGTGWCEIQAAIPGVTSEVMLGPTTANSVSSFAGNGTSGAVFFWPWVQTINPSAYAASLVPINETPSTVLCVSSLGVSSWCNNPGIDGIVSAQGINVVNDADGYELNSVPAITGDGTNVHLDASATSGEVLISGNSGAGYVLGLRSSLTGTALDTFDNQGNLFTSLSVLSPAFISTGTKFITSGCSVSSTTGGAMAGTMTLGANNCSVLITINGGVWVPVSHGLSCHANDETTAAANASLYFSTSGTMTATLVIPSTAGASDVIDFACTGY